MKLQTLISSIDAELKLRDFVDASYNGLQVEGASEVTKVVLAVSACQEVFDMAADLKAQLVIVHHGLMWEGTDPRLVSIHGKRIKSLFKNNISLAAYHLPLDAHLKLGNNAQIAQFLGIKKIKPWGNYKSGNPPIGVSGDFEKPVSFETLIEEVNEKLNTVSSVLQFGKDKVKTAAIVSGGAGNSFLSQALEMSADVLITGELNEPMYNFAKEAEINVIGAAHYASERWGVLALGEWIKEKYGLECEFVEVENPL